MGDYPPSPAVIELAVSGWASSIFETRYLVSYNHGADARESPNAVIIVAPRDDMAKWAELVRDVESAVSPRSTITPEDR